jgi:hypothetical protein
MGSGCEDPPSVLGVIRSRGLYARQSHLIEELLEELQWASKLPLRCKVNGKGVQQSTQMLVAYWKKEDTGPFGTTAIPRDAR